MLLAGQARTRARRASTTLASAWRMRAAVTSKKQTVANVTALQVRKYKKGGGEYNVCRVRLWCSSGPM